MKAPTTASTAKAKATTKTKAKAPAPPPAKKPSPADATQEYNPSKDRRALAELIARRGVVDADHRAAYEELISDEDRATLGAKTRAPGVFRDAVTWGVQIDQAFSAYPALVKAHYAEARFAYFLERLALLGDAVSAQQARRGDQGTTRSTAAERESAAREARQTLLFKLRGFAGKRAVERKALSEATGRTDNADALGVSIQQLTTLGAEWLARPTASAKIQCASAGLTMSVITAALGAGEALTGAATEATLAGRRPSADAPEVNLLEGAVLHEMDEAQRCFNEAHTATQIIPRLSPGPATRQVLGVKSATSAAPADATTTAPAT
jgi:hypothetical protein